MRVSALEAAAQLLVKGEDEAALEALVDCWRDWKAVELATVVEQLASRLGAAVPPIVGSGAISDRQAWLTVAEQRRTATLPRLFETLPRTNGLLARERIDALALWSPSPLIATALAHWLQRPPFEGQRRARCFPAALQMLERQQDPRFAPLLKSLVGDRPKMIRDLGLSAWKPLQALAKRAQDWALAPKPRPVELAALEALRARGEMPAAPKPTVDIDALFAAVYAQPDDDTARLVLADVLQEAGNPRGELIALQLGRAATGAKISKRERTLVDTWGRDWLGALDPVLMKQGIVFEGGFLTHCAYNGVRFPRLNEQPEWSTVTHLEVADLAMYQGGVHGLLLAPALKSLRHLQGVGAQEDLRAIAEAGRALEWESLLLRLWTLDGAAREMFAHARLPMLTTLGIRAANPGPLSTLTEDALAGLFKGPLASSVRHLELAMPPPMFGTLVDFAGTQKLTSLTLQPTSRDLQLRFDVPTRSVVITLDPVNPDTFDAIVAAMTSVRRGTVDRVLLRIPQRSRRKGLDLGELEAAIKGAQLVLAD